MTELIIITILVEFIQIVCVLVFLIENDDTLIRTKTHFWSYFIPFLPPLNWLRKRY